MGKLSRVVDKLEEGYSDDYCEQPIEIGEPSYEQEPNTFYLDKIEPDQPPLQANLESTTESPPPEQESTTEPPPPGQMNPIDRVALSKWDRRLRDATAKDSLVAENIRKLRAKILHPDNEEQIRSILVTSTIAEEGKSFICANIGVSIAKSIERHALLVDCDMRRPNLTNLFGLKPDKGLTDYLQLGDPLPELIHKTGLDKLSVISAGKPPENPAELLSADRMSAMIEEVTSRYDDRLIILDTPPYHAASETLVLSQKVDKVILVVRWGKAGTQLVKKVVDDIGGEKILGVVFNAVETNIFDKLTTGLSYQNYYSSKYK